MKIAVVCDDLVQRGGAEKLVLTVLEIWPQSTLFTSYVTKDWVKVLNYRKVKYKTSFLQKIPFNYRLNKVFGPLFLYNLAFSSFDFKGYDIVFSISARYSHCVITKPKTKHIVYFNSPGRMFWEPNDYFKISSSLFNSFVFLFINAYSHFNRVFDFIFSQRPDYLLSNSKTVQSRVRKYYKRNSKILYPFVDISDKNGLQTKKRSKSYYLVISRLQYWKRVDIAIEAANKLGLRLKIIGKGEAMDYLVKMSGSTVDFLGYVSEKSKISLIKGCKAVIITQKEDFGIVPLEAMSLGKPVIAYGKGGVRETVIEGITGEFFDSQDSESLIKVLSNFDENLYDSEVCKKQASKFSKERFMKELKEFVNDVYLKG